MSLNDEHRLRDNQNAEFSKSYDKSQGIKRAYNRTKFKTLESAVAEQTRLNANGFNAKIIKENGGYRIRLAALGT
jgi:hypothetical protein